MNLKPFWLSVLAVGLLFTQQADASHYAFAGGAFTFSQGDTQVPDVVGAASFAAADATLEAAGLDTGATSTICSSAPTNQIVTQSPGAGTFVNAGALIDLVASTGVSCWDLTGIPSGWYSIANATADQDFVALMRQEASGDGVWAYWLPGAPRNSANLRLNLTVIRAEANGSAEWARWAPGTSGNNSGNLQLNMTLALTADFQ